MLGGRWGRRRLPHDAPPLIPQKYVVRQNRGEALGCAAHEHASAVHPRVVANRVAREERVAPTIDNYPCNVVAPYLVPDQARLRST